MYKMIKTALVVAVVSASAASAAIVENGSFEQDPGVGGKRNGGQVFGNLNTGPGASWNVWDSLPGWTASSGYGIEVQSDRTLGHIDAQHGQHYVELDSNNNSSMFQDVVLGIGQHTLSFFYSPRTHNRWSNGIDYGIKGIFADTVTGPHKGYDTHVRFWTEITQVFNIATAGTYRLYFGASGHSDSYGGLIDNVSIAATPSQVPLPAPALMLVAAAGGLALLRRRSRQS